MNGRIWNEGYCTALADFGIQPTGKDIKERISPNPHSTRRERQRLTDYERHEIARALGYHFDDCPGDRETQTEIMTVVVERILSRRPERGA